MRPTLLVWLCAAGCGGSEEAVTLTLPVETRAAALEVAGTDLGYAIEIGRLRVGIADLELTIEGELHDDERVPALLPHPGHAGGGEVTGELPGDLLLIWDGDAHPLGDATLLAGAYQGANWTWRAAGPDDVEAGDPLLGHTFHVEGVARRDELDYPFDAVLDIEPETPLTGAPFALEVGADTAATLQIEMLPVDPFEGDTAFDGVDFAALPVGDGGVIEIRPGDAAHNVMRRTIQTHDHYAIAFEEP